jgi:AraC-like DNA-binding protein
MTVETPTGLWVVPPLRAVWIPEEVEHAVQMSGWVRMRTLYFLPEAFDPVPGACCAIEVSPLLRELILEAMRVAMLSRDVPEHERLATVLLDQLVHTRAAPLQVRIPQDVRARRVAAQAQADLSADLTLSELAADCGASVRTVERIFLKETGLTFAQWLQRIKALAALERLAAGDSVTAAGLAVGYDSTSSFIAMFKRILGTTPGNYFQVSPK